ncbi:MAG: hypothetical protein WAO52_03720 [Prolixibacteraceae bacterium]
MMRTKLPAKRKDVDLFEGYSSNNKSKLITIETEIQTRICNIKNDIYEIGRLLYDAKKLMLHGFYEAWIKKTFNDDLPYSTAYFYMRVYKVFRDNPKTVKYIPTKYLLMVTSKEFPEEIIKVLDEHPENIDKDKLDSIKENYSLNYSQLLGQ